MLTVIELLRMLGMPNWIVRCARGEIAFPDFTVDVPCNFSYGFPPALLPLWSYSSGPSYIGVLHHWFGHRKTTFGRYDIETRQLTEVARSPDQLRVWIVFDFLSNVPDADEVAAFAESVELCTPSELGAFFEHYDEVKELVKHPVFKGRLPLDMAQTFTSGYSGDFPNDQSDLRRYCQSEVSMKDRDQFANIPPWFGERDKPELFRELLDSNDYSGAWFCLNSIGWKYSQAKLALRELSDVSGIEGLTLLSNWIYENLADEVKY